MEQGCPSQALGHGQADPGLHGLPTSSSSDKIHLALCVDSLKYMMQLPQNSSMLLSRGGPEPQLGTGHQRCSSRMHQLLLTSMGQWAYTIQPKELSQGEHFKAKNGGE
jgi:hypothetical protein